MKLQEFLLGAVRRSAQQTSALLPRWIRARIPARAREYGRTHIRAVEFYIDIVGTCNLRCPSCPVGNAAPVTARAGSARMDVELFRPIVQKINRDYPGSTLGLFNWTEPFLHPKLADFVRIAREEEIPVSLSSNFNAVPTLEAVVMARPTQIVISVSGFTQEIYERGHANGRIDRVKANMARLAELCERHRPGTRVEVYYHKYRYNIHEMPMMRQYAESLGFTFREVWALYQPLEAAVSYLEGTLPAHQRDFIDTQYLLSLREASAATAAFRDEPCSHPTRIIAIDALGRVQLCCGVFDKDQFSIGPFLELSRSEIHDKRVAHSYCGQCASHGLHIYSSFQGHAIEPEFDRIAERAVRAVSEKAVDRVPTA